MNKFFDYLDESPGFNKVWNIGWTLIFFAAFSGILGLYISNVFLLAAVAASLTMVLRYIFGQAANELLNFNFAREIITVTVGVIILILVK